MVQFLVFDCDPSTRVLQRRMPDKSSALFVKAELVSSHAASQDNFNQPSRRMFLGQISATLATGALAAPAIASAQTPSTSKNPESRASLQAASHNFDIPDQPRVRQSFDIRLKCAIAQALIPIPSHLTSGDQQRYPDGSATYTKTILQDSIGLVNPAAYQSFKTALASGKPSDFENIIIGGTRTLNGPQGGLAFTLEGTDSHQFGSSPSPHNQETEVVVPAPPAFSSPTWGTELTELYWCSLLRDLAFTDYAASAIAVAAC